MSREWAHSVVEAEIPDTAAESVGEIFRETGDEELEIAGEEPVTTEQHAAGGESAATGQHAAGGEPAATGQHAAGGESAAMQPRTENGAGKVQTTTGAAVRTADEEPVLSVADSLAAKSDSLCHAADPAYSHEAEAFHYSELDSVRFGWSASRTLRTDLAQLPGRDTTVEALFGGQSCAIQPERLERPVGDSFTDNAVFQSFVLLLAAT